MPNELIEAARLDGLTHAGVFFRIVCPISKSLFASIAILNFTGTWNSYMVPATFINRVDKFTLVIRLTDGKHDLLPENKSDTVY